MTKKDNPNNEWVGGKQIYPDPKEKDLKDDDWLSQFDESILGSPTRRTNRQVEDK